MNQPKTKHLIPLTREPESRPSWAQELKELVGRLVDLAVGLTSSNRQGLVLENVLTPEELATRLKLPVSTVLEMARSGKLPAFRVGRHWRFDLDVLKKALPDSEDVKS